MTAPNGARRSMTEVTDSVGLSRRHWVYFALIALILLADGMDVTLVSHTFPSLIKEWGVSIGGGITVVVTGGFIAMGIGATIAGRLADLWGRKSLLVAAGLLFSAATALGATSDSFTITLSGMFLLLLVPIGVLLGTLAGLKADAKRTGTASLTGFQEERLAPVAPVAIDPAR